ncbi:MAG TPA: methionyl-tRNA formyltransferase [Myxococcaceae bacterium]|nr:methionyl-tRNA formyltransferase [Myxococcaceae bacterium]
MERPRIVFMGTPAFAVPSLLACAEVGVVVAVVTQPDKPKGRGQALAPPPVKVAAEARGIRVIQPAKLKTPPFAPQLQALRPDLCVVTAYGRILPREVLEVPPRGCLNVHASLLPRFRGAAPIQWAIAAGDAVTGVCLMQMDEGLDTGPVLARRETPIGAEDTSAALHDRLAELGGDLLREALPGYLRGELVARPQPAEGVVLAPLIDKAEGHIDFNMSAAELERRLRAFTPWPGLFTSWKGQVLKVHRVEVGNGRGAPGDVLAAGPSGIEVACREGSLRCLEVQLEGRRRMSAAEFLAGQPVEVGSQPFR